MPNEIFLSIIGTLFTIVLTFVARGVITIGKTQSDQAVTIGSINVDISNIKEKVDSLHQFRNELQQQEVVYLREKLKETKHV